MCPEAKALSELLIYNPVSTVSFLYTLEPGYAQKAKANFNLLETRWSCCGFYITFNFSRLIFYSNVFFPQISCRCLSVWRFHFAAVKVPKKRQARDRERKSEERERGERKANVPLPYTPSTAPLCECEDLTRRCFFFFFIFFFFWLLPTPSIWIFMPHYL